MNLDLLAKHFYDLVDVLTQQVVSIFDELQRFFAAFSSVDFSKRNRCKQKNASQTDFYWWADNTFLAKKGGAHTFIIIINEESY